MSKSIDLDIDLLRTNTLLQVEPLNSNSSHMAACTCMWEMYSTIRTSKVGLGTLLSHFALPISLLRIKKSCPTSAISSSIQKHIRPVINMCHCLVRFRPCLVNLTSITMPRRYEPSSYEYLFSIPEFAQCRKVFLLL
jgi:hypothetical protein